MEEAMIKRSNRSPWEQQTLINDLKQGRELAKQLKNHLNPSTASTQTRQFLVEKIISSYEKTLAKLNSVSAPSGSKSNGNNSSNSTPRSQASNHQAVYDNTNNQASSKKRKALPKWTEQVQVKSDTGLEGPLDDGHGWRKYGQKDILGAVHPRAYYRCTHKHVHGCLATKQVQRSDEDPTIFHVTYLGEHKCNKAAHSPAPSLSSSQLDQPVVASLEQEKRMKLDQFRFSFGARTKNEDISLAFPIFSSFETMSGNKLDDDNYMFMPSVEVEGDQFMSAADQSSCFSPFCSTSDSDFFQPCNGLSQLNVDISESDLVEAGSCLNSVSNSPMGVLDLDLDFPTGSAGVDFDTFLSDLLYFE